MERVRRIPASKYGILIAAIGAFLFSAMPSFGDTYVLLTADGASIDSSGNVLENGQTYRFVFKPDGPPSWVLLPYLTSSEAFQGGSALGLEIDPTPQDSISSTGTDKANVRISSGNDSYALDFSTGKYTGFAVKLGQFDAPSASLLIAQWWQGSPYSPPLSLHIIPGTTNNYEFQVRNNSTGGNPGAQVIHLTPPDGDTLDSGSWHTFVVYTQMHYVGQDSNTGEVTVWHNGVQVIDWCGDVGYNPAGPVPVNGTTPGSDPNPNPKFDIFVGPYRDQQSATHQTFWDQMRFASSYSDADPQGGN